MIEKNLHIISKYSLMLLVYCLFLAVAGKIMGYNYMSLFVATVIYGWLLARKILFFSSSWIDEE